MAASSKPQRVAAGDAAADTRVRSAGPGARRAHAFVAALALLLDRALEKKLRAAGSALSSPAAEVLKILRLRALDPPEPVKAEKSLMW